MTLLVLVSLLLSAAPVKVIAEDESAKDKSFAAFKKDLEAAVKKKDGAFLKAALDRKVQAGFGSGGGVQEFLAQLPIVPNSPLWPTLETALGKGCARYEGKEFVCPALFAKAPDGFDWFENSVLKKEVVIRKTASADAPALATRSFEVVTGLRGEPPAEWVAVSTQDGLKGFVRSAELDSPLDTRVFFKKGQGGWKLTFLGAGD